jgi:hypothetical protein
MRRALATLLIASALAAGAGVAVARLRAAEPPEVRFTDDTPADVRALARRTWDLFAETFPTRWECLEPVTVHGAWELADRGSYDAAAATVSLRIPGTAPNLEATLVHEFAHHLEATCPEHVRLRASFLRTQGLAPDTPWFGGRAWPAIPSERLAEAMTVAVLERRPWHLAVHVDPAVVEQIRRWGEDG